MTAIFLPAAVWSAYWAGKHLFRAMHDGAGEHNEG